MRIRPPFALLTLPLLLLGLTACNDDDDDSGAVVTQPVTVTVLHSNDTHSNLEPFTPTGEPQQGGVTRRKTLVDRVRASEPNVLVVDAGDFMQGTLFYNAWKGSSDIMAMNAIRYDVATFGNHEFDLGPKELGRVLRGEPVTIASAQYNTEKPNFPIVSTNVDASAEPALTGLYRKSLIIERGGEKFGILGVTTDTTANIASPGPNVKFLDYVASVQAEADNLRTQGVNKIILLSHYGYDVDVVRAKQLSGVDIIVSGHDHALLGNPADIEKVVAVQKDRVKGPYPTVVKDRDGNNVLIVSAYEWGRWLGQIKVTFDAKGLIQDGAWQSNPVFVRGCDNTDCSKEAAPEDPTLKAKVAEYKVPITALNSVIIGQTSVAFDGTREPGLRTQEMPLGNLIADTMLRYAGASYGAKVAITNGGGIRAGLPAGDVNFGQAVTVLPFGNTISVLDLTGAELVAALDNGLSKAYDPATNATRSTGAFPQVSGLNVTYCKTPLPAVCPGALRSGGLVTGLKVGDQPVNLTATYRITTNNFMAGGGDFYATFKAACDRAASGGFCQDSGVLMLDALVTEFQTRSPVSRQVEGRIVAQ